MKKLIILFSSLFIITTIYAQTHVTVDLGEDVYSFLTIAEQKGYCKLENQKPYTESYIINRLNEIYDSVENDSEKEIVEFYLSRYEHKKGVDLKKAAIRFENDDEKFPTSFSFGNTDEGFISSGIYNESDKNSTGYELFHNLEFFGDLGKYVSFRSTGYIGLTKMEMEQLGNDYDIGYWWYDDDWLYKNEEGKRVPGERKFNRTINTFRNYSVLPFSYKKKWDGSIYYLSNISGSGLEGWPVVNSLAFGMYGDLRTELLNEKINIGFSRVDREWAGMDYGSSLVLNANAAPFFAGDVNIKLLDFMSFSSLTGFMEYPNAGYINSNAWYLYDGNEDDGHSKEFTTTIKDSYFFQNCFSIGMINLDTNYLHLDFGSTSIWPKRFEGGYMFPLVDKVVYQNLVGDYDNLALFGDIKGILPGFGCLWASLYLDELYSFHHNPFNQTRIMYAYQAGSKANLAFLPFTTVSLRYTKVEPYCYTHQAIKNQPYYNHYIGESYTNNGTCLGYYLQPNSDELFLRIESKPKTALGLGFQYQFIRHGADYGSGQVRGSSIWSELPTGDRDIYKKYFLHDGAYEWSHIIELDATYDLNAFKFPLQLYVGAGYIYDYWTKSEGGMDEKTPYHRINTAEYPTLSGAVITVGFKAFSFANFQ